MYKENLKKNLKIARKKKGLSQQVVADFLCTTQSTIAKYESGALEPNIETLCKIALFYDVSTDWLLGIIKKN